MSSTQLMVLPQDVLNTLLMRLDALDNGSSGSASLQFVRLLHPRTEFPSLFILHRVPDSVQTSILEVQVVSPNASRSWFMDDGYVVADGKLILSSSIDPVFLLVPILQSTQPADGSPGNFRTLDDIFEEASMKIANSTIQSEILEKTSIVKAADIMALSSMSCILKAMKRICEYKDISEDISVYRFSQEKLISYLEKKVARLSTVDIQEQSKTLTRALAKDGLLDDVARKRTACELISQYTSQSTYKMLLQKYDFQILDQYLESQQTPIVETVKGGAKSESADGKKRKTGPQASRGVEKLKKVNTKGMSKLSTFFNEPVKPAKA